MVSSGFKVIIFALIHENLAKYYYKDMGGRYDVYYGPKAIWGYKEIKPPKSFKVDFENRGERPGTCENGDFMCHEPYLTKETEIFECEVDYQCPTYFKCCQPNCFQHKICQPANLQDEAYTEPTSSKSPLPVTITSIFTTRPSSITTSAIPTRKTTTSTVFISTTTSTPKPYDNTTSTTKLESTDKLTTTSIPIKSSTLTTKSTTTTRSTTKLVSTDESTSTFIPTKSSTLTTKPTSTTTLVSNNESTTTSIPIRTSTLTTKPSTKITGTTTMVSTVGSTPTSAPINSSVLTTKPSTNITGITTFASTVKPNTTYIPITSTTLTAKPSTKFATTTTESTTSPVNITPSTSTVKPFTETTYSTMIVTSSTSTTTPTASTTDPTISTKYTSSIKSTIASTVQSNKTTLLTTPILTSDVTSNTTTTTQSATKLTYSTQPTISTTTYSETTKPVPTSTSAATKIPVITANFTELSTVFTSPSTTITKLPITTINDSISATDTVSTLKPFSTTVTLGTELLTSPLSVNQSQSTATTKKITTEPQLSVSSTSQSIGIETTIADITTDDEDDLTFSGDYELVTNDTSLETEATESTLPTAILTTPVGTIFTTLTNSETTNKSEDTFTNTSTSRKLEGTSTTMYLKPTASTTDSTLNTTKKEGITITESRKISTATLVDTSDDEDLTFSGDYELVTTTSDSVSTRSTSTSTNESTNESTALRTSTMGLDSVPLITTITNKEVTTNEDDTYSGDGNDSDDEDLISSGDGMVYISQSVTEPYVTNATSQDLKYSTTPAPFTSVAPQSTLQEERLNETSTEIPSTESQPKTTPNLTETSSGLVTEKITEQHTTLKSSQSYTDTSIIDNTSTTIIHASTPIDSNIEKKTISEENTTSTITENTKSSTSLPQVTVSGESGIDKETMTTIVTNVNASGISNANKMLVFNSLLGHLKKLPSTIEEASSDNIDPYFNTFLRFVGKVPLVIKKADINESDYGNVNISSTEFAKENNIGKDDSDSSNDLLNINDQGTVKVNDEPVKFNESKIYSETDKSSTSLLSKQLAMKVSNADNLKIVMPDSGKEKNQNTGSVVSNEIEKGGDEFYTRGPDELKHITKDGRNKGDILVSPKMDKIDDLEDELVVEII